LHDANPDWNAGARRYLAARNKDVDIGELAPLYHRRVHDFYDTLLDETDKSPPAEVADYRRCWNAHRQRGARLMWGFLLAQYLTCGLDPYNYLDRYLTPAELQAARKLPDRSRAQVDFIIQSVDEFSACDERLRLMIYRLFGVPDHQAATGLPEPGTQ
jgi:hypothetical protein